MKIDIDEQPQLATFYAVQAVPTLIVQRDGQAAAMTSGYSDVRELEQFLADNAAGQ